MSSVIKAIVTGHSRGLGKAVARELVRRAIPVLGLSRRSQPTLDSPLFAQVPLDLADSAAVVHWLARDHLRQFLSDCDEVILINNAGTVQPVGALHQQEFQDIASAVSLNVAAPLMLAAAITRAGSAKKCRILHVSSGAARSAYPGWSVYCATKAALDHHARAVHMDGDASVRICSLAPGIIDTDMQAAIRATPDANFPMRQRFVDLHQQHQLMSPADCATALVAYVLSDDFGSKPVDDLRSAA